ncbi:hypothetical protein AAHC03_01227 [Spirometra sp. Aus1]|nr:unnamed protein product [Spirometra erinaceieuropaei]
MTSERKRAKLDFLTEEEKAIRRKILNREAAQKARDRKKDSIKMMEQCIAQLRTENRLLRLPSFTPNSPGPDFFLPELSPIEVSSEVTIPPPETVEVDAHEVDIAPIVSSSSVYDLIYQSFCDSEGASDVILSPSSTSDESLDDILQCLEADGYCSDALESTMPPLTPECALINTP